MKLFQLISQNKNKLNNIGHGKEVKTSNSCYNSNITMERSSTIGSARIGFHIANIR